MCYTTLQEPRPHSSDDVIRSFEHGDEPVPDTTRPPADPPPAQTGQQEPRHDDGGRQRRTARRRRMPVPVPLSTVELFCHVGVQPRRIDLRKDSQERQVDHVVMHGITKCPSIHMSPSIPRFRLKNNRKRSENVTKYQISGKPEICLKQNLIGA